VEANSPPPSWRNSACRHSRAKPRPAQRSCQSTHGNTHSNPRRPYNLYGRARGFEPPTSWSRTTRIPPWSAGEPDSDENRGHHATIGTVFSSEAVVGSRSTCRTHPSVLRFAAAWSCCRCPREWAAYARGRHRGITRHPLRRETLRSASPSCCRPWSCRTIAAVSLASASHGAVRMSTDVEQVAPRAIAMIESMRAYGYSLQGREAQGAAESESE
jgi:hypothetical protein